jgi:hypothetical protein
MSEDILEINEEMNEEECILKKNANDKIYYQCKLCNFVSERKEVVKKHLNKKNKCYNTDSNQCKHCKLFFKNKSSLENHLNKKKKCYYNSDPNIEIKIENNIYSKIEKLELNEEKLKKQIFDYENEIKRLKDTLLQQNELIEKNKKDNDEHISNICDTFFQSYINKFDNLDLMFFTTNFIRHNSYNSRVMEYKKFIINLFDKISLEALQQIFKGIEEYKKQKNFELLFKDYQKELELRDKNNEFKKNKSTPLEWQLNKINDFIKKNYEN